LWVFSYNKSAPRAGVQVLQGRKIPPRARVQVLQGCSQPPRGGVQVLQGREISPCAGVQDLQGREIPPRTVVQVLQGRKIPLRARVQVLHPSARRPRGGMQHRIPPFFAARGRWPDLPVGCGRMTGTRQFSATHAFWTTGTTRVLLHEKAGVKRRI